MPTQHTSDKADTLFKDVVRILDQRDISAVPVVNAQHRGARHRVQRRPAAETGRPGTVRGALPTAWFQRHWDRARKEATTAGELMTSPAITIGPESHRGRRRQTSGPALGIVSRRDLLTVFLRKDEDLAAEIAHDVFERNLDTVVNPSTVTIEVKDGVATLRGQLQRKSMIPIAETLTRRIDGIVDVDAHLAYAYDDTHIHIPDPMAVDITKP
jgi:CBS domain-containing protein